MSSSDIVAAENARRNALEKAQLSYAEHSRIVSIIRDAEIKAKNNVCNRFGINIYDLITMRNHGTVPENIRKALDDESSLYDIYIKARADSYNILQADRKAFIECEKALEVLKKQSVSATESSATKRGETVLPSS